MPVCAPQAPRHSAQEARVHGFMGQAPRGNGSFGIAYRTID
jgi:hypothetical protein